MRRRQGLYKTTYGSFCYIYGPKAKRAYDLLTGCHIPFEYVKQEREKNSRSLKQAEKDMWLFTNNNTPSTMGTIKEAKYH